VELFVRQARKVRPSFALTEENAAEVVAVCRRLDGLPLAIELAAARSKLLSPAALLTRLGSASDLHDHTVGRPARQRTLRDTIGWSYRLLAPDQQVVFQRLGVFLGGVDLEAVQAVTSSGAGAGDALDAISDLVDASLVTVSEGAGGEPRFALFQTVAEFALEALAAAGDEEETRARHAEYFLLLAERLVPELRTHRGMDAQSRLLAETDNFRAALTWTLQPDAATPPPPALARIGLRLCAQLATFWTFHTYLPELRRWTQRALELDSGADTPERAAVLVAQSSWWDAPGDPGSRALLEEALGISRHLNDPVGIALALADLAEHHMRASELDEAAKLVSESVALAEESGDSRQLAYSLLMRGRVATEQGGFDLAVELFERAQDLDRRRGQEPGVLLGDVAIAQALAASGRAGEAAYRLHRVAADILKLSNPVLSANALAAYAQTCAALGEAERAARLLGAHWALWAALGEPIDSQSSEEQAWLQRSGITAARDTLDKELWDQALQTGASYTLEEAFADACQANIGTAQPSDTASVGQTF
jgi:tetratricopeptide (TPR) repeat protein